MTDLTGLLQDVYAETIDYYMRTPQYKRIVDDFVVGKTRMGTPTTRKEYEEMVRTSKKFFHKDAKS